MPCLHTVSRFVRASLVVLGLSVSSVQAVTLDFEELSCPDLSCQVNATFGEYNGFQWPSLSLMETDEFPLNPSGYQNGAVSGDNVLWGGGTGSGTFVSRSTPFDFNGATFTAAWRDGLTLGLSGWNNGVQLFSDSYALSTQQPLAVNVDYLGIDTLSFTMDFAESTQHWVYGDGLQFAVDDFKYDMPSPVPEPEIYGMMLTGLGIMGLVARRKKRQAAK